MAGEKEYSYEKDRSNSHRCAQIATYCWLTSAELVDRLRCIVISIHPSRPRRACVTYFLSLRLDDVNEGYVRAQT